MKLGLILITVILVASCSQPISAPLTPDHDFRVSAEKLYTHHVLVTYGNYGTARVEEVHIFISVRFEDGITDVRRFEAYNLGNGDGSGCEWTLNVPYYESYEKIDSVESCVFTVVEWEY